MTSKRNSQSSVLTGPRRWLRRPFAALRTYWRKGWWQKLVALFMAALILLFGSMYAVAQWYIWSNRHKHVQFGVTFIPDYARQLGTDPQASMQAMIDDLGVRHFRLVSYWDDMEPSPGQFNFTDLDWQFAKAEAAGVKVTLSVGLRQPRWPECHMPAWAQAEPKDEWYPQLTDFMHKVVERYKDSPVLQDYQLENEYFLKVFGKCTDFSRQRLEQEYRFLKQLDGDHPVIVSRSNNWIGVPLGLPTPDEYGVSVYKRIWDNILTHRYLEYPYPAWYYGFYAGASKLLQGKEMVIHELQAEPWLPPGYRIEDAPIPELYKSLNPKRLKQRFAYGKATGIKQIDLWGAEWWYQMKVNRNSPEVWNVAKRAFADNN